MCGRFTQMLSWPELHDLMTLEGPPLGPCAAETLAARPVSTVVNDPRNDDPRCIRPAMHPA